MVNYSCRTSENGSNLSLLYNSENGGKDVLMKRLIAIGLLFCLVLIGCAKEETIEPITTQPTETETEPTVVQTQPTEEETEPVIEETEPVVVYRNPLTGEVLDQPYTGRIVSVSIGNTKDALPHLGIAHADMIYEVETEGGITRFMPIFSNYDFAENIGPVRSARTYYNNISASYGACLAHCGGSVRGIKGYYDLTGGLIPNWVHLDQRNNGAYFFRDSARKAAGYLLEHTMCTTGEKMTKAMADKGYAQDIPVDFGYRFAEDENLTISGQAATEVVVSFLGKKTTTFVYDAQQGVYGMSQYNGRKVIDGNTNEEIFFKNLIVIYSAQSKQHDGYYSRSYYDLIGSGNGYFAVNGQIVPIKWSRAALTSPFVYTLEDGTPITLGVGTTYVAVASPNSAPIVAK